MLSIIDRMKHVTTQQKNQPLIYHSLMRDFAGSMTFSYYVSQLEFDGFLLQIAWLKQKEHRGSSFQDLSLNPLSDVIKI